jgi:hypothetical protein
MAVTVRKHEIRSFIDPFIYLALGSVGLVLLAFIASIAFWRVVLSTSVTVYPEDTVEVKDIQLQDTLIGALRVDVKAKLPTNQWVTYEIQLRDQQTDEVIAAAIKQAWKESGTWQEDGESGTWQEQDVKGGLDVRTKQAEQFTISLSVLEYGDTAGQTLDLPIKFDVSVQNGVVDTRYLWIGLIGTIALAILSIFSIPSSGRKVIHASIDDSDPSDRAEVGGADTLLRVVVSILSDETSPSTLDVTLRIKNSYGEQVYAETTPVKLGKFGEDTYRGSLHQFFILEPRDSYGFQVEVLPDAPIDKTTLTVREGSHTIKGVNVIEIKPTGLEV